MVLSIHQPQYMPWIGYFHKIASSDIFVFLDDVQFKKNEWQHRNRVRSSQGWQWLSVPNHYRFPQLINEVKVFEGNKWKKDHLNSIKSCYGRANYFDNYIDIIEKFYNNSWETMGDLCMDSVKMLLGILGIGTKIEVSSNYDISGVSSIRLKNICEHFNSAVYLSGIGGRDYLDESIFRDVNIEVIYQDFICPSYDQYWSDMSTFIHSLSVLDLIFNCGDKSYGILMSSKK
jgi:hypothetical protein